MNHQDWIKTCENVIDIITVFGAIAMLIVWAILGMQTAAYFSFFGFVGVGASRLVIKAITYFNRG